MRPALLLVDLQDDFLRAPGLEPAAGEVVARCAALLAGCRARGVPVIHVRTTVRRGAGEADARMPHWKRAGKWACVEGTEGHRAPAPLDPRPGEPVAHKTQFSAFSARALGGALAAAGADTVVLAGVHLHGCVRATALDAYARGLAVYVAEDAVASDDPVHAAATRRWLGERAGRFLPVEAILRALDGVEPPAGGEDERGAASAAAAAAHEAWPAFRSAPAGERAAILERAADLVEADADALAALAAAEIGKPIRYGGPEMRRAAALLRAAAGRAAAGLADEPCGPGVRARRRPHGVVAIVTPWNNPVAIPLGKIGPALAYGNTVVWKPAPAAAGLAARIAELLERAGAPPGILGLVPGGAAAARAVMEDARVRAISLTGGVAAGRAAQEVAARRHLPLQAELGGNNAAIVWSDADLEGAAAKIAEGAFGQAGQRCTANRRAIVDARCATDLVARLARATGALVLGDPADGATHVGPLVSTGARDRVAAAIERARAAAREVIVPHAEAPPGGAFLRPTIVCCDDPAAEIVREETFGPVLVVQRAGSFEEALDLLNGVRHGLAAALFSPLPARRERFLEAAEAGVLKLGQATADAGVEAPFGGWKASGVGAPEHGAGALEFYTRAQAVYEG